MGQEISSAKFCRHDFSEFAKRLKQETHILKSYFEENAFESDLKHFGVELEACLVDKNCVPAAKSEEFLTAVDDEKIVPELSKYNFEINSKPIVLAENSLQDLHNELETLWYKCRAKASELDLYALETGILPTFNKEMLSLKNIHPYQRYLALDKELAKYRHNQPIVTDISGVEQLTETFDNVLIETVATSLQVHLQLDVNTAVRFYNAAHIISAPLIAISANSPFLLHKNLWSETRIPVFEQAAAVPHNPDGSLTRYDRVNFGYDFAKDSLLEPFIDNLNHYLILLPEVCDVPENLLPHLRLHNGTIWRWNRPLVGIGENGRPNLRVEHRVNPAGPSIPDVVANVAFFIGLVQYYANQEIPPEQQITFKTIKENFYRAAKEGLDCSIIWLNDKLTSMQVLLSELLIPQAKQGLALYGIDSHDIDYYLKIIEERLKARQTGAAWQRNFIAKHGPDFENMLFHYIHNQQQALPVYQWKI